jgi:hypothetical protein
MSQFLRLCLFLYVVPAIARCRDAHATYNHYCSDIACSTSTHGRYMQSSAAADCQLAACLPAGLPAATRAQRLGKVPLGPNEATERHFVDR